MEIAELKQINDLLSSENKEKVLVLKAQEKDLEEKNKQLVLLANKFSLGNRCSFFFLLWLSNVTCWLVLWPDVGCHVTYMNTHVWEQKNQNMTSHLEAIETVFGISFLTTK